MTQRLINPAGLALVQQYEQGPGGGVALTAYKDIAGIWTIGWGHTGGVYAGDTISAGDAMALLYQDLAGAEQWVAARTDPMMTSDNQFAAMVSLTFNIGETGFLGSTVRREHNAQMFSAAAGAFLLWDKAHIDGQLMMVRGLLNRRIAEQMLYLAA